MVLYHNWNCRHYQYQRIFLKLNKVIILDLTPSHTSNYVNQIEEVPYTFLSVLKTHQIKLGKKV